MNLLILFYYIRITNGYFIPLQDPAPTNTNNCPCGITCFVTNPDCQPCFGTNCIAARPNGLPVVELPQGALADYSQYNPQPLLRLAQTYVMVTPPPPVPIPVLKQPALITARTQQEPMNWSLPPLYVVQVPPSTTRTESNGQSGLERLFLEEAKGIVPRIQLHAAAAPSTPPAEESTTVEPTISGSTTSTSLTIPVDESDVELFNQENQSKKSESDVELFNQENQSKKSESHVELFNQEDQRKKSESHVKLFNQENQSKKSESHVELFNQENQSKKSESHVELFNQENQSKKSESDVELFNQENQSSTVGTTSTYPTTQDLEDEQPFTPTLELDPEDARTAITTTMDPIEGLLAAWADKTTENSLVAVTSELTEVHKADERQHNVNDASIGINTVDTKLKSGFQEVTTRPRPVGGKSVQVEKTNIELFQTTHSIPDYFGTTPRVPSTTALDISNEIETMSAPVSHSGAPSFVPSEEDISGPMSERKDRPQLSFRMQMPTAPPCAKKETLTVFTGYKAESVATPASSLNGSIRGHSFSKPTKLYDERGKRFYRKHRESGTVGKQQQVANGRQTTHKTLGTSKQLRQQMGTSLFQYKAKTRPKCNSVELKRLMQEDVDLARECSKIEVASSNNLHTIRSSLKY